MMNRKILAMVGVSAMMIGLVACGSKAESNIAESATPAPTAEATPTPEPTEEPAESHDFDSSVNKYKSESDIEIKQYSGDSASDMADCDSGTDIEDIDTLYDWLYSNGVTRESVQNDRDSGCKNPYLEGYLEYLDNLDKPSETPSNTGFGPGAHVKLEGATKTTYPGTDVEALEKDGVYYTVFSDGTTDGSYYVIDNEGNLSVELPWMGELQQQPDDDATDKVKEAFNDPEYIKYAQELVEKYGG